MNKILLVVFFFILLSPLAHSQDFVYGDNSAEEMSMKKYNKDTAARAVVLNEYGLARISDNSEGNIRLSLDYHVKIKLLTTKGFDKATVEIPLRILSNSEEEASDIKGYTTYLDDSGNHQTVELDSKSAFTTKENKYWKTVKFTLPNLRPGCIIEYKYTTKSAALGLFPSWKLQDDIPKVNSRYDVHIPGFWNFNISLRGNLKLTKNTAEIEKECFSWYGAKADCSFMVFQMENIPAFVEEDYMTSPKNFMSAVYFELSDYTNPSTGQKIKVAKEWADIDFNLKRSDYFGSQLKKKDQLKPYIASVIAGKTDDLEKAKAVYAYIQKTIKWNKLTSTGSDNVRKALDSHSGTVGDINLALVAALSAAGIRTEAVLLSTRTNGFINKLYPVEDDFNYVVARANIGDKTYMLDATDPLLGFDMLPLKCLNDQGRVMSLDKPSFWIDMVSLSKQRKSQTSAYDLTLQSNGKLKGTITTYYNGYDAYEKRTAIKKFNTQDEYIEDLDERLVKTKILSADITNLDSLNLSLVEKLEVEIDVYDNLDHSKLAFNPFFFDRITNNPFKLNERNYPVDKGMPSDDRFMLTMHLPADYVVDSAPQGVAVSLPNQGGKFITNFVAEGNTFTFSNVLQFTKTVYEPEEYPYLKELYNKIIATEKAEIVFKKK
ncbi:transglutaminase domain-containing protein [Mucilaginibacter sp.]|uniref:transglutaminase domain-containing protein n=1 Tax=Mucilaginibacter sp. TaxID=1882438 RepID=UPI0032644E53